MTETTIVDIASKYHNIEQFSLDEIKQALTNYKNKTLFLYHTQQLEAYHELVQYHFDSHDDDWNEQVGSVKKWFKKLITECCTKKNYDMLAFIQQYPWEEFSHNKNAMPNYICEHFRKLT